MRADRASTRPARPTAIQRSSFSIRIWRLSGPTARGTRAGRRGPVNRPRPDQDQYSVRIRNLGRQRFVAAVELVEPGTSPEPSGPDRVRRAGAPSPSERDSASPSWTRSPVPRPTSSTNCCGSSGNRRRRVCRLRRPTPQPVAGCITTPRGRLETWAHPLEIGRPMPTLPVWLAYDIAIPLDLEADLRGDLQAPPHPVTGSVRTGRTACAARPSSPTGKTGASGLPRRRQIR